MRTGKALAAYLEIPLKDGSTKHITIHGLPKNGILDVAKVVRTEDMTIIVDAKGKIYSPSSRLWAGNGKSSFAIRGYAFHNWSKDHVRCLIKLGILTKEDYKWHLKCADEAEEISSRRHKWATIVTECKALGIKAPKKPGSLG